MNDENGIKISSLVSFTHLNDTIVIDGNQISNNDSRGVYIRTRGRSASVINEAIYITGNTIDENHSDGIKIAASLHSNSTADGSFLSQRVTITGNSLHSNDDDGIQVGTYLSNAGGLSQAVNISFNTIDGTDDSGIQMRLRIRTAGVASTASVTVSGNSISNTDGDGIYIRTRVSSATLVQPTVAINGNTLSDIGDDGIFLSNRAGSNGTLSQNITINDNTLSFIDDYGIKVRSTASGGGASLSQALTIDPNTINHVGSSAIYVSTHIHQGATGTQNVLITDNTIADVGGVEFGSGIKVRGQVGVNSLLSQGVTITNNTLYNIPGVAIFLTNAVFDGTLSQTALINNNTLSHIDFIGIGEATSLRGGGLVNQGLSITGNTIDVPARLCRDRAVRSRRVPRRYDQSGRHDQQQHGHRWSAYGLASYAFISESRPRSSRRPSWSPATTSPTTATGCAYRRAQRARTGRSTALDAGGQHDHLQLHRRECRCDQLSGDGERVPIVGGGDQPDHRQHRRGLWPHVFGAVVNIDRGQNLLRRKNTRRPATRTSPN